MISQRLYNANTQQKFTTFCLSNKLHAARIYFSAYPEINLNEADPATGQTLLHKAYIEKNYALIDFLRARDADETIRDKKDNLPLDYFINPNLTLPSRLQDYEIECRESYRTHMIYLANKKLSSKGLPLKIIFIKNIEEINFYIKSHPTQHRIGFIVEMPNCIKPVPTVNHVAPIYFERVNKTEYFIQIDSNPLPAFFVLPESANPTLKRKLFFSPFLRQIGQSGCIEDAIIIMMKLLNSSGLIEFVKNNSIRKNNFPKALSYHESLQLKELSVKKNLNQDEITLRMELYTRQVWQYQVEIMKRFALTPVTEILELTNLPKMLLSHIQRFDTMRFFRVNHPDQFKKTTGKDKKSCLDLILKSGLKRQRETTNAEIAANLTNPRHKYDFAGVDFLSRRKRFLESYCAHGEMAASLSLLKKFAAKSVPENAADYITARIVSFM